MPDVLTGGGAGAGSAAPAPAAPSITFGGGTPAAPPAETPHVENPAPDTPDKFEFTFEGDNEKYTFEDKPETHAESEAGYDASKPFDPKIEAALKDNPGSGFKALKARPLRIARMEGARDSRRPREVKPPPPPPRRRRRRAAEAAAAACCRAGQRWPPPPLGPLKLKAKADKAKAAAAAAGRPPKAAGASARDSARARARASARSASAGPIGNP